MADRKLQYIIEILPKLGKFDDIKKKLEDGVTLSPKEIQLLKGQLGEAFKGASQEAMALGKEIKKAMSADGVDTSTLVNAVKMIAGAAKELEKSGNPIESWSKIGSSIIKPLGDLETRLNNINNDLSKLKDSSKALNELKSSVESLRTSFAGISSGAGSGTIVSDVGNIAAISTKIDTETKKAYDSVVLLEQKLNSIKDQKITLDISDIKKEINILKQELNNAIDADYDNGTFTRLPIYKKIFALQKQAEKLGSFQISSMIPEYYEADYKDSLKDFGEYATKIKQKYNDAIKNVGKDSSPNALVNQLKDVKLSLRVPPKSEIVNQINSVLKTITSKDLESVKINIGDSLNVIGDKTKRSYGNKPAVEDANTQELITKTESRFEKIANVIKDKQYKILDNTNTWRQEMIKAMSIAAKDLEFQFGWDKKIDVASGELFDSIQEFFNRPENRLNLIINDEGLKTQIQNIISSSGLNIGGNVGTATIDLKAIADVMRSVFYGTHMSTFKTDNIEDSSGISQVNDELDEVTENSKEYAKELSATTINIKNVINSLRDFAKVATKENASRGSKDIATWLSSNSRGIDIKKIANGASDVKIIDMLQNALMIKDNTGRAIGRDMPEDLGNLMKAAKMKPNKGAGKSVNNLIRNINELFKSTEVETELNQVIQARKEQIDIYKSIEGAGRSLALLNKIRPSNKNMSRFSIKNIPSVEDIDKAIENFNNNGYNIDELNNYKSARIKLGDKTDEQSITEFKSAVEEFRKTISPLYNKLQSKWGDYKGQVSIEGRKYPIPINTPNDMLKVPDGAKIVDAITQKIYESVKTDAYVDENGRYNFRADRKQQKKNSYGDKSPSYTSILQQKEDILSKPITYEIFKPKEISKDLDLSGKTEVKKITDLNNQIQQKNKDLANINAQIEESNKKIDELNVKNNKISNKRKIQATEGVTSAEALVQKLMSDRVSIENNIGNIDTEIETEKKKRLRLEQELSNISDADVQRRKNSLKSNIENLKSLIPTLEDDEKRALNEYNRFLSEKKSASNIVKTKEEDFLKARSNGNSEVILKAENELKNAREREASAIEKLNKASEKLNESMTRVNNIEDKREHLLKQISETTLETVTADKKLEIERSNQRLMELQSNKDLQQKRLLQNQEYYKGAIDDLNKDRNKVAYKIPMELEKEQDKRSRLINQREQITTEITAKEQEKAKVVALKQRVELQREYNTLQEQELNLKAEITKTEEENPTDKSLVSKKNELDNINASLEEMKKKILSLGGFLQSDNKEYSDTEIKQYARKEAKSYQALLYTAKRQKNTATGRIEDIERQEKDVKQYKLGAGAGFSALNSAKYDFIKQYLNSDYVTEAEKTLKDKAKQNIDEDQSESQKIFDKKISEAMSRQGWNPWDKVQVNKFLKTEKGQQLSAQFQQRLKETEESVWTQYELYKKDLHNRLLEDFKASFSLDKKGVLSATFKTLDENGNWIDEVKSVDVKGGILSKLASQKEILKNKEKEINTTIKGIEAERDKAMAYGGIGYDEIRNDKYLTEIESFESNIADLEKQRNTLQEKLTNLEPGDVSEKQIKEQKNKINAIQEEIDWNNQLIENRRALIEQKEQERLDSKATPEEKAIAVTKQLTQLKESLAIQEEKITQYKKNMDEAKGTDKETFALKKYNDALAYKEKLQERISSKEQYLGKLNTYINTKVIEPSTVTNGEISSPTGGIVGAIANSIREGIGSVNFDTKGIATETTLHAILEILGGGGSSNSGLTADEKARMAELEAKGASRLSRNISIDDRASDYRQNPSEEKLKREAEELANYLRILRDAIGNFDGRSNAKAQADFYSTLNDDVREAGYWVDQSKDILNGSNLKLLQKFNKLKNNWNKYSVEMDKGNDSSIVKASVEQLTSEFLTILKDTASKLKLFVSDEYLEKLAKETSKMAYSKGATSANDYSGTSKIEDHLFNRVFDGYEQLLQKQLGRDENGKWKVTMPKTDKGKSELWQSIPENLKNAGRTISQHLEKASDSTKEIYDRMLKLSEADKKYRGIDNIVPSENDDELDSEVLSKILERIEGIQNRISNLEDSPEKEALINESKELSKLIPDNDNYGRTIEEEAELQSLRDRNINTDGINTSTGIVGIMQNELAKESTLSQVLNKLGEIAKRNAMSGLGKANSAQDLLEQFRRMLESDAWEGRERVTYIDLNTGTMSNQITGDNKGVSAERLNILRNAYKDVMDLNAQVHTHADTEDPYFSEIDLKQFSADFADGITKQILLSKNNMTVLDMTDVKNIDGLLKALANTKHNFEDLAATASKFGAKYISKAFNEITPQGLVKMLGIKGIESKLSESETRESARKGVATEEAKEAASIIQESTGRAVKTTVERVGLELETLTEKTDIKGNKTWSSQINNKTLKAMQATNKQITGLNLNDVFGTGTNAQVALIDYTDKYAQLLDLAQQFKSVSKDEQTGLQTQINQLLPLFTEAEKKLISLIARKDKFMGDKEAVATFTQAQMGAVGDNLKTLATNMYAKGLIPGENIAFNGMSETQNGTRLLIDVLKDGTIQQYALEVDRATGQVKEFMLAETALANAFQNVNKAMRLNETVKASVAVGDNPTQQQNFLNDASSPLWNNYKKAMSDMETYVANIWNRMANGGKGASQEELDYIMALSEKVIYLGKAVQKTSIDFKNFWAQNPENVTALNVDTTAKNRDIVVRSAMEELAKNQAIASKSQYDFVSFDNDTLTYKLTDVEGKVRKVSTVFNELYHQVATTSDKSVVELDPVVAKIERYRQALEDAKNAGYLMDSDTNKFSIAQQEVERLARAVENGTAKYEDLIAARKRALYEAEDENKVAIKNRRLYTGTNEINAAHRQFSKIQGNFGFDITDASFNLDSQTEPLYDYITAYNNLNKLYQQYANQHKLNDPAIQEELRKEAYNVQYLGRQYNKSATEAQNLEQLVEQSKDLSIIDSSGKVLEMGGVQELTDTNNLRQQMENYAQSLGHANMENVKFNATKQQMTYTMRINKDEVADMVVQYNKSANSLYLYNKQQRESLTGFKLFAAELKKKMGQILQYTASITSLYRVFNTLRQGITYVKEIDAALTELKKVTDETEKTYDNFLNTAAKTASKVGSTIKEVVSSTADFARLGSILAKTNIRPIIQ